MRKLVSTTFLTLDGVMQAPGAPEEDNSDGFQQGGWSVPYFDETLMEVMGDFSNKPFAMVLGRKTYDIMRAHWPNVSDEEGGAVYNSATKYVASRGSAELTWQNSEQLRGDIGETLGALKKEDGPELQVHGSADLLQTLLRHGGLIDEMQLLIFPVVVGGGKRLFENSVLPQGLKLVDQRTSGSGVVVAKYAPQGSISTGSFALE